LKSKAKPAPSKKRAKPDTEDEDEDPEGPLLNEDSLLSATPPSAKKQKKAPAPKKTAAKPLQEVENEAMGYDGAEDPKPKKGSKSTETYQKVSYEEDLTW
jgi:DNA topoisomerase-2